MWYSGFQTFYHLKINMSHTWFRHINHFPLKRKVKEIKRISWLQSKNSSCVYVWYLYEYMHADWTQGIKQRICFTSKLHLHPKLFSFILLRRGCVCGGLGVECHTYRCSGITPGSAIIACFGFLGHHMG